MKPNIALLCVLIVGVALADPIRPEDETHKQVSAFMAALKKNNQKNLEQAQKDVAQLIIQQPPASSSQEAEEQKPTTQALQDCAKSLSAPLGLQGWEQRVSTAQLSGKDINEEFFALNLKMSEEIQLLDRINELSQLAALGSHSAKTELSLLMENLKKRQQLLEAPAQSQPFFPDLKMEEMAKTIFLQTAENSKAFSVKELAHTESTQEALSWLTKEIPESQNGYFSGAACSCRDFAIGGIRSCCINDGLLIDLNMVPCNDEEKKLSNSYYRENYCIYVGTKSSQFAIDNVIPGAEYISFDYSHSKVYLCFKSPIGKALHTMQMRLVKNWIPPVSSIKHEGSEKNRYKKYFSRKELETLVEYFNQQDNAEDFWKWYRT